ncbi:hypothetical protein [Corynebacterium pacaense]|uniref:hypothetical protein n=1 Tax=Corynebacterium pacaense TaxID=1816684 RepID=UPI0009BBA6A2|nr:hypothetical protein [Corynebacterium pacaense]
MQSYTLKDGESRRIPAEGSLRIEAFAVGGPTSSVTLSVNGENLKANVANASTVMLIDCPSRANLTISPTAGGAFGPGESARVTITQNNRAVPSAGVRIELPLVRVDGANESVVGGLLRDGDNYVVTAHRSATSTNLDHRAMAVLSAIRGQLPPATGITAIALRPDGTAASALAASPEAISAVGSVLTGLATALAITDLSIPGGFPAPPLSAVTGYLQQEFDHARTGIGVREVGTAGPGTLTIHVTAFPRISMASKEGPTLVLVFGPSASDEARLFDADPGSNGSTAVIALGTELLAALDAGDSAALVPPTSVIAPILGSGNTGVIR